MPKQDSQSVDTEQIQALLKKNKRSMKLLLTACAGCTLCAESCFLFMNKGKAPEYMPSYKVLNSLGKLYRKHGKISRAELEKMRDLLWKNCMLCERCYCALGIDLPKMIAFARRILRSQGIDGVYPHSLGAPEDESG
jgi:succinate dehydrogenase/fumarate reductase-like Fe-S protein